MARVALVTGGTRGIGFMIAQGLLEFGCARVYISSRKAAQCDEAARQLSQYGECISIPGDVSTLDGIKALVAEIGKREQAIDIARNHLEVLAARSLVLLFGASLQSFAVVLMTFILGIGQQGLYEKGSYSFG